MKSTSHETNHYFRHGVEMALGLGFGMVIVISMLDRSRLPSLGLGCYLGMDMLISLDNINISLDFIATQSQRPHRSYQHRNLVKVVNCEMYFKWPIYLYSDVHSNTISYFQKNFFGPWYESNHPLCSYR